MKKNLFFGLALFGVAFAGAAFTASKGLQAPQYIQKPGVCEAIPDTGCRQQGETCFYNDTSGPLPVYRDRNSASTCATRLRLNN